MSQQSKLKQYLDSLIDQDGLKTEVKVTITAQTTFKLLGLLVGSGIAIALAVSLLKNFFPNRQLTQIQAQLEKLTTTLKPN